MKDQTTLKSFLVQNIYIFCLCLPMKLIYLSITGERDDHSTLTVFRNVQIVRNETQFSIGGRMVIMIIIITAITNK